MSNIQKFFVFLLFYISLGTAGAQVIENYDDRLFKVNQANWIQSSEMIQVTLDARLFPMSGFQFRVPASSTVFIDESLWFYAFEDSNFYFPSEKIRSDFKSSANGQYVVTILKKGIQLQDVHILKGFFEKQHISLLKDSKLDFTPEKRNMVAFYDFFYLALVIILFLIAIYKVVFPMVLASIISPSSVFSPEDFSETNSFQKFFSIDVIFYVLIVSLMLALFGMCVIKELGLLTWNDASNTDLNLLFMYWLMGTIILFLFTVLKFILLKGMVYVFELGKYEFSHFFYLMRIISILVFVNILILIYFSLNDPMNLQSAAKFGLISFFWTYITGVFLLLIIMMNRVSFKKYHLFAYICTAELVPFLIISKLVMG
jgi:hypothetical protein